MEVKQKKKKKGKQTWFFWNLLGGKDIDTEADRTYADGPYPTREEAVEAAIQCASEQCELGGLDIDGFRCGEENEVEWPDHYSVQDCFISVCRKLPKGVVPRSA